MLTNVRPILALILISGAAVLGGNAGHYMDGVSPVLASHAEDYTLFNVDSYERANRLRELLERGDWYDGTHHSNSPPLGMQSHWTRLLDGLALVAAAPLQWFLGDTGKAVHRTALLIGPVFGLIAMLLVALSLPSNRRVIGCLFASLALPFLDGVMFEFAVGNFDHHSILILAFLGTALGVRQSVATHENLKRASLLAGFATAAGIWATPEGALILVPVLLYYSGVWAISGEHDSLQRLRYYLTAALLGSVAAFFLERPPSQWGALEPDRLSMLHIYLLFLAVLGTLLLSFFSLRFSLSANTVIGRTGLVGLIASVFLMVAIASVPDLLLGPFRGAPGEAGVYLANIDMFESTWPTDLRKTIFFGLYSFPGVVVVGLLLARLWAARSTATSRERGELWFAIITVVVYLFYTLYQLRGCILLHAALLVPIAEWGNRMVRSAKDAFRDNSSFTWKAGGRLLALGVTAVAVLGAGHLFSYGTARAAGTNLTRWVGPNCNLSGIERYMPPPTPIFSRGFLGPIVESTEISYRTGHASVHAPFHRRQEGIRDAYAAYFSAPPDREAREVISRRRVDYVVVCRGAIPPLWRNAMSANRSSLLTRLTMAQPPNWLEYVPMPAHLSRQFGVYRVRPNN